MPRSRIAQDDFKASHAALAVPSDRPARNPMAPFESLCCREGGSWLHCNAEPHGWSIKRGVSVCSFHFRSTLAGMWTASYCRHVCRGCRSFAADPPGIQQLYCSTVDTLASQGLATLVLSILLSSMVSNWVSSTASSGHSTAAAQQDSIQQRSLPTAAPNHAAKTNRQLLGFITTINEPCC